MNCYRLMPVIVALLLGYFFPPTVFARTVVVVYDNSGSMDGYQRDERGRISSTSGDNRFAYASYSLQTLRALMGPKDELSVVFTSSPGTVWRGGSNTSGDITHLRDVTSKPKGNTPYAAVEKALEVLKESRDPDRWLVMITDGQFQAKIDVPQQVDNFLAAHSRGLKVLLLGLGEGVSNSIFEVWKEKAGAKIYYAKAAKEIREQMQQIAAIVSSNTDRGIQVDAKGNSITFTPRFPLRRFTVLQQTASARSASTVKALSGDNALDLSPALTTQTPSLNDLFGTINQVRGQGSTLIPAGIPVTVTFDRPVDISGLAVLPEVDARLEVKLTDETGNPVHRDGAIYNACFEHTVSIEVRLVSSSDTPLENTGTKVKVEYNGKSFELTWDSGHKAFTGSASVAQGTLPFRVEAINIGYIYAVDAGQIRSINNCPPREIGFSAFQNGKPVAKWSGNVMSMDGTSPFELVPSIDGRPMTKDEAATWKCSIDSPSLPLDVHPTGKGGWFVTPKERWCTPCLTPTGSFSVQTATGKVATRNSPRDILLTLTPTRPLTSKDKVACPQGLAVEIANPGIVPRCWKLILYILGGLIFLWWLVGIIKKNRFAGGANILYLDPTRVPAAKRTEALQGTFADRWLIPYRSEQMVSNGILFKAGSNGKRIYIAKEQYVKGMRIAGDRKTDDQPEPKDKLLQDNEKLERIVAEGKPPRSWTYNC